MEQDTEGRLLALIVGPLLLLCLCLCSLLRCGGGRGSGASRGGGRHGQHQVARQRRRVGHVHEVQEAAHLDGGPRLCCAPVEVSGASVRLGRRAQRHA
uniref:Putative secreted protein n=1 Tax=Ixodes ricinus TaxID=34613 RepID=A0A6B0U7K0_IXORI